jgi:hypothetical protein
LNEGLERRTSKSNADGERLSPGNRLASYISTCAILRRLPGNRSVQDRGGMKKDDDLHFIACLTFVQVLKVSINPTQSSAPQARLAMLPTFSLGTFDAGPPVSLGLSLITAGLNVSKMWCDWIVISVWSCQREFCIARSSNLPARIAVRIG